MNNRQIKKNSKTAKALLMMIAPNHYSEKVFTKSTDADWGDTPKGTWEIWGRTCYEYDEWDSKSAYDILQEHIFWSLTIEEFNYEKGELTHLFSPNLRTSKKVFDLAKEMIKQGAKP